MDLTARQKLLALSRHVEERQQAAAANIKDCEQQLSTAQQRVSRMSGPNARAPNVSQRKRAE